MTWSIAFSPRPWKMAWTVERFGSMTSVPRPFAGVRVAATGSGTRQAWHMLTNDDFYPDPGADYFFNVNPGQEGSGHQPARGTRLRVSLQPLNETA